LGHSVNYNVMKVMMIMMTSENSEEIFTEKKENKLRDVTSHIFAQATHAALPAPKLVSK